MVGRRTIEAIEPPPGVVPNFVNPPSIGYYTVLCATVCLPLITIFVGLRIFTKVFVLHKVCTEDFVCVLAWMGATVYVTLALALNNHGAGKHQWNVTTTDISEFNHINYFVQILYGVTVFTAKLSILLLLSRIFGTSTALKWRIKVLIAVLAVFYATSTLLKIFICIPIRKVWTPTLPGTCLRMSRVYIVNCIASIVSDFIILILPMSSIWGLKTTTMRKVGITALFAAGAFACVSSIIRFWESTKVGHTLDKTYSLMAIYCWSVVEVCTGIICGCIPMMPALYHHIFHSKRKTADIMTSRRFQLDRALRKPPVQPDMCLQSATDFTVHDFPWLQESGESRDTKREMVHAAGGTEAKLANEARNAEGIVVGQAEEADSAGTMRRESIRPTHPQPPTLSSETLVRTSEPGNKENEV
ncbi:hypothetical protein MMC29_002598 [Sticta canariensis]|nr:hypothetical protein [Sticta canariensis]